MVRKSEVRTKRQALEVVTGHITDSLKEAGTEDFIRAAGFEPSKMTKAEVSRLEWAIETVDTRLNRLSQMTIR